MKRIKIIILLSMFFGFSSVFAQSTSIETGKSDTEKITVKADSKTTVANQPQTLNAGEVNPATENAQLRAPQKQNNKEKKAFVKTRPYPNEVDTSQPRQTKSNSKPATTADKSEVMYTPANPDPKKLN